MDSLAEEFKTYCANLRRREKAKCFHLDIVPVKIPKFDVLKYERSLETGVINISVIGFNLSLSEATVFQKTCPSRFIKVEGDLIFIKWTEIKPKED